VRVWMWVVYVRMFALFWLFALFWYVFYRLRVLQTRRIAIPFTVAMAFGLVGNLLTEGYRLAFVAGAVGVLARWYQREQHRT
jgi:hypothetical protein